MGGPINAGNSVHSHDWKNEGGAAQLPYMEGDTGDIMDDYRLTFVWEQRGAATMKPSGDHHIFLSGDTMPRSLSVIGSTSDDKTGDGIAMIYSPKNVALYYECENTSATRSSISLDFHVGGIRNEDFEVFGISPPPTDTELETGTLGRLITNFPVHDYASHFHSLLFSPTSLNTILTALDTIRLPPLPPPLIIRTAALKTRYDAYQKDNIAHVPPSLSTARETPLLWNFVSVVAFQHRLCLEMQFDLHRPLGTDLFPRSWADQHRECARTWMRGLPFEDINKHLTPYMSRLSQSPVTKESILSTRVLRWFAGYIERRCLELMSRGLENGNELLYSISALARAIGDAVDGAKEVDVVLEPWIDDTDLWIYRARCAYLFWCAEWAAGIMMLVKMNDNVDAEDSASVVEEKERREMRGVAVSLLGNWMAWAFVVEGLPARPFRVRKPVLGSEVVK
ncbi:hypothetical protein K504DRAFT_418828 [Pleomassaria siparia CBS 279.74]|uniref:Uncharacterized protein n=1 Tax=Pleomassaria siparia CBS 279.74 TaxID=1314801 RepID=A0A6G1JRQ0_9PLEO|nr:hypothetical protein K504DRAFT_418828 [Pleomassaria siparia CBS 279.74]